MAAVTDYRLMERVCRMYYTDEFGQNEIARKLGISRTAVSRLLTQAKQEGFVSVHLDFKHENFYELQKAIEEKYGLREVIITPDCSPEDDVNDIGIEGALYLKRLLKPGMKLAITWGRFMQNIINAFEKEGLRKGMRIPEAEIIPLLGSIKTESSPEQDPSIYTSVLASRLADILNCSTHNLPAPMYVKNPEVRTLFCEEPLIADALALASSADAALFGIGSIFNDNWIRLLPEQQYHALNQIPLERACGEIIGRVYDSSGTEIVSSYNDCIIGISLEELKKIPIRIALAYGSVKLPAIRGALAGNILNVLITDRQTAYQLLEDPV
ncbi:MAG: sugar-binding transcriptional regulator [Eubacteriaceae bacterium]|jgi:DNA-binding transcriptional regulator LsrR (DeoR family)